MEGAKHNQALQSSEKEYRERVLQFFERHLAEGPAELPTPKPVAPDEKGPGASFNEKREFGEERGRPAWSKH